MTDERAHEYGPSRVGHGEAQCIHCLATNRENAVIAPNHCSARPAPSIVTGSDERAREVVKDQGCRVPPSGWWCSRKPGHDGPCAAREIETGWIVASGDGKRWRTWKDGFSDWTDDREQATRYHRREDAEAVHSEDEDAWFIQPYAALAASRPTDAGAGLLREALERIQDEPLHTLPIVTTQRMRNIASYALRGERLA